MSNLFEREIMLIKNGIYNLQPPAQEHYMLDVFERLINDRDFDLQARLIKVYNLCRPLHGTRENEILTELGIIIDSLDKKERADK